MNSNGIVAEYLRRTPGSKVAYERAQRVIPGGLTQGTRFYQPYPLSIARANGAWFEDVDGHRYVDYWQAATSQFLGHSHPAIVGAVQNQLFHGTSVGLPYPLETQVAERLCEFFPSAEMIKFTNSGMEGAMLACRIARARTGRKKIAVFRGHFHGWEDQLYSSSGIGIPEEVRQHMIVLPFNDLEALEEAMEREALAAVLLEPFSTNAGAISPQPQFLPRLRELTEQHGSALIFDEVVTNFRLGRGGAQEYFGVVPDLTVLGKPLAGGFVAVGAVVGRTDWMEVTDHRREQYVYHGAWQSPVVMAAVRATLDLLADGTLIAHASRLGERLRSGLNALFKQEGVAAQAIGMASVVRVHFIQGVISSPLDLQMADVEMLKAFHLALINRGHFVLPGKNMYTSVVHEDSDVDRVVTDAAAALRDALSIREFVAS